MSVRKHITFSDNVYQKLEEIKLENGFGTDSEAIAFLIVSDDQIKRTAIAVREELEENYMKKERLNWATKTAEQNSIVLLDAVNTMLHMLKADACIPVELAAHPVVNQSQERIKEKIAHFKQKSDERKSKEKS